MTKWRAAGRQTEAVPPGGTPDSGIAPRHSRFGSDQLQPIRIAEKALRVRPYPGDLFDAARAYRGTLEPLRSPAASRARRRLDLLLWHDVRQPSRGCWTRRIQRAVRAMNAKEAFAWQWLLRYGAVGMWKSGAGKSWAVEGKPRLALLGTVALVSAGRMFPKSDAS